MHKEVEVENLMKHSVVAQRVVFEAVKSRWSLRDQTSQ